MQTCPICQKPVKPSERYPAYVCAECFADACSPDGRKLNFFNTSLSGGYSAAYADTGEPYDSHECLIHGVQCRADEHRFGGIVIVKVEQG